MLQEVLRRYAGKIHLHLELKSGETELAAKVAKELKDCDWLLGLKDGPFAVPGLTITSAKIEQVERSLKLLPSIPHHWLCWDLNEEIIEIARAKGFAGVCISPAAAASLAGSAFYSPTSIYPCTQITKDANTCYNMHIERRV